MKNILRKIIENLKYVVPTACFISVIIVFAIAFKANDLKNQGEDKNSEYNTAEEEFFGKENNTAVENEMIEDKDDSEEEIVYGISTYKPDEENNDSNTVTNEVVENTVNENEDNTNSEKNENATPQVLPRPTSYSEEDKNEALRLLKDVIEEEDEIIYKEFSNEGYYIFDIKRSEDNTIVEKAVDVANKTTETVFDEE